MIRKIVLITIISIFSFISASAQHTIFVSGPEKESEIGVFVDRGVVLSSTPASDIDKIEVRKQH